MCTCILLDDESSDLIVPSWSRNESVSFLCRDSNCGHSSSNAADGGIISNILTIVSSKRRIAAKVRQCINTRRDASSDWPTINHRTAVSVISG